MEKIDTEFISYTLTKWYVFATETLKAHVGSRVITVATSELHTGKWSIARPDRHNPILIGQKAGCVTEPVGTRYKHVVSRRC